MAVVEEILTDLSLRQYHQAFLDAGFSDWESLREITERDFLQLGVRLGDRRKLQREIARRHRWPDRSPLPTTDDLLEYSQSIRTVSVISYPESHSSPSSSSPSTELLSSPPQKSRYRPSEYKYTYTDVRDRIIFVLRERFITHDRDNMSPINESMEQNSSMSTYHGSRSSKSASTGLREALVDQLCHNLSFPIPGSNILSRDQVLHKLSNIGTSNRPFKISDKYQIYLDAFLKRLNPTLHLFDEISLRENFQNAISGNDSDEIASTELLLALALGATFTGTQPHSVHLEMYIRGRYHLSFLDQWSNDLWMMRILVMIALYHLTMFPDSTSYFLDLAIRLGQSNGLDASSFPLPDTPEPTRSHWLRVWKSAEFLQHWLRLTGHGSTVSISDTDYLINTLEPPLLEEENLNSRLTQMNITVLGTLLKEVLSDHNLSTSQPPPPSVLAIHLNSLSKFYAELPFYFCLRPKTCTSISSSSNLGNSDEGKESRFVPGVNDKQKSSILNVHILYQGIKCQLLQPALLRLLETTDDSSAMAEFASQCVESAKNIIELCEDVVKSGFELKGHWIVLYFLHKAMLLLILASIQAQNDDRYSIWKQNVEYVSNAAGLLEDSSDLPSTSLAGAGMDVIRAFLESLEFGSRA